VLERGAILIKLEVGYSLKVVERVLKSNRRVVFALKEMFQYDSFLERDRAAHEQRNVVAWGVAGLFPPVDW
jgi:hypothetical protein